MSKKNCLIIRKYAYIVDLLMLTPTLRSLSNDYVIDILLSDYHEIFFNLPYIRNIFSFEDHIDNNEYDIVIELNDYEYNYERIFSPFIEKTRIELFAEFVKVNLDSFKIDIRLSQDEEQWANEYLIEYNLHKKKIILFGIRSTSISRDWPIKKWKELIEKLKSLHYGIIVVDKDLQWQDKNINFFASYGNIRKIFALTSKVDYILCNDSGLLHIGGAFEKPTLGIFGPTDPELRCVYKNSYWIKNNLNIKPAWFNKSQDYNIIKTIEVEDVERKFLEIA